MTVSTCHSEDIKILIHSNNPIAKSKAAQQNNLWGRHKQRSGLQNFSISENEIFEP